MGQGFRTRRDDRTFHGGRRPSARHAAGQVRRRRVDGPHPDVGTHRPADGRRVEDPAGGAGTDPKRDRGGAVQDRGGNGGRPLAGRTAAHAASGRGGQEDPRRPLAQRSGVGRSETLPARRTAADGAPRAHALRPFAGAERTLPRRADARLYALTGGDALVVRVVVRRLCRDAGGRHATAGGRLRRGQSESAGVGGRLRLVVPAGSDDDHAAAGVRRPELQRRGGADEPRQERTRRRRGRGRRGRHAGALRHGRLPLHEPELRLRVVPRRADHRIEHHAPQEESRRLRDHARRATACKAFPTRSRCS